MARAAAKVLTIEGLMEISRGVAASTASTDIELVGRTLAGEREVFGELALRYERQLFSHLLKLTRNRDDAEEMTQEALLRAYKALPHFPRHQKFGPWLFRIGTNLAIDASRRAARIRFDQLDESVEQEACGKVTVRDEIDARRQIAKLRSAIDELPPVMAAILNLRYREEMKMAEIAEAMGSDANSIGVLMHRARAKLRTMLCAGKEKEDE